MIRKSESRFSEKRARGRKPRDQCSNKTLERDANPILFISPSSMSRKSGNRFSEKDMRQQRDLEHFLIPLVGKYSRLSLTKTSCVRKRYAHAGGRTSPRWSRIVGPS